MRYVDECVRLMEIGEETSKIAQSLLAKLTDVLHEKDAAESKLSKISLWLQQHSESLSDKSREELIAILQ